jgi:transmembrane sensor
MSERANDIAREAATWLERREREDWSEADNNALESWLAQSPAHKLAFWRVKGAWSQTERLNALRPTTLQKPAVAVPTRKTRPVLRFAAAAIAAAVIAGFAANNLLSGPRYKTYSTGVGVRETITLPDGSQIELNTDTSVRVAEAAFHRNVVLDRGEAFFQIKHDAAHPFVVTAGNSRVVDLGTKFTVRAETGRVEVALVEGRARIEPVDGNAPSRIATLTPGDVAVAEKDSLRVSTLTKRDLADDLGWRRGVLVFRRTTLAEAAAQFNRYNTHKLVVPDSAVAELQLGGTFQSNNPELFARVARDVLGLRIQNRGGETVISR